MAKSPHFLSSPWLMLFIVLLASVAAPLNQFKVPPVMPLLMEAFRQPVGAAGLLMSVFAITGGILALPAGFIFQRLGIRATGSLAILTLALGAMGGAVSWNFASMLASRFIEGAGMSLISILAPAIIALWFSEEKRGKAMGIWAVWVPLGTLIMFLLAPLIAERWNWRSVWWFGGYYTIFVGLLFFIVITKSGGKPISQGIPSPGIRMTRKDSKSVLTNCRLWLLSFLFGCFNFAFIALVTWAPTFLTEQRGVSMADAASRVSLLSLLAIFSCPTAGWVSDKIGSRKIILVWPMVLMGSLFPFLFGAERETFILLAIVLGFVSGFVPTGVFAGAVEVAGDERLSGMAMAVIQIGQNVGMLLGPLVVGWMIESKGGWEIAFWLLAPVSILGALSGWLSKVK
jgi:MFS family permease